MADLAINGGQPAVLQAGSHFSWPPLGEEDALAVVQQLSEGVSVYNRSGVIEKLEDALCEYHSIGHAVLTSSGTAALHSMYAACGLRPGDEVIVPAYTFFATVTPLLHLGVVPVLAECNASGNLDPLDVQKRITSRTRAIVVTHMWGSPAEAEQLRSLADAHQILLFEDGSHAHGAAIQGRKVGTFGHAAAFSMNGPKPLSAGEGGFVLTSDDEIYYKVLLHGQYNKRCKSEIPVDHEYYKYATTGSGLKFRIHPVAARIALQQLAKLDSYLDGRDAMADYIAQELRDVRGVRVPCMPAGHRSSWYGMTISYVADELGGLPAERFYEALRAEGCKEVDRPGSTCPLNLLPLFQDPSGLFPGYANKLSYRPEDFPKSRDVHRNTLKMPVWHKKEDKPLVDDYITAFRKVSDNYRQVP